MKTAAIICEYNPFHNGHAYQIDRLRKSGFDRIVAVMSGNLVQRGELAVCDKFSRAKAALAGGADIVAEIPSLFSMSPADSFARAGVFIAERLGCDTLAFGSETADTEKLTVIAERTESPELDAEIGKLMKSGLMYPAARQKAFEAVFGSCPELGNPNDILALEYIKAIKRSGAKIEPFCIERKGVHHDGSTPDGEFASASYIRSLIAQGKLDEAAKYIPKSSALILRDCESKGRLSDPKLIDTAIISKIRGMSAAEFSKLCCAGDGLEFRLYNAARKAGSVEELINAVKTKRYTMARIKRAVLSAYFGLDSDLVNDDPHYVRILGLGKGGADIVSGADKRGCPIVMRGTALKDDAMFELESKVTDMYVLSYKNPLPCGSEYTTGVIKYM